MNQLVNKYNNTCHRSIGKKAIDADYSDLYEKIETNLKPSKFKVSNGVRITKYNYATGIHTSNLASKKDFLALKAEVHKLDINELIEVPTSLNNLKTEIDDLDVGKFKTVPVELKKLSDVVSKEFVKNTQFQHTKHKRR